MVSGWPSVTAGLVELLMRLAVIAEAEKQTVAALETQGAPSPLVAGLLHDEGEGRAQKQFDEGRRPAHSIVVRVRCRVVPSPTRC